MAASKPRFQRRFYRELSELLDRWAGDDAETRAALTRQAVWMIFERLCARVAIPGLPAAERDPIPTALAADFEQLLVRFDQDHNFDADLLGYVFEHSLARKELGAYFTAPDVAAYICRSTLLPRLFERAGSPVDLRALAGAEGVRRYLPASVWQAAPLPLESPYEQRRRQLRLIETVAAWDTGRIATVADCLPWNLDLTRIALDSIERTPDETIARRWAGNLKEFRVLDPTCGCGDFLLATYDLLELLQRACQDRLGCSMELPAFDPLGSLYGVDLLPGAIEVARMRLRLRARTSDGPGPHLIAGDFVAAGPSSGSPFVDTAGEPAHFDAVIGNPPYVGCERERERYRRLGYTTAASGNLYALVMERSLSVLAPGGRLGMIVPISSVSGSEFQPLVRCLTTGSSWVSTYSNRPAKLFAGVEQRLAIWLAAPDAPPRLHVSPYQHWWREERPQLFERFTYVETRSEDALLPKTGCPIAERIFGRVTAHDGQLAALMGVSEHAVWLHDGPTYWVRALPFQPNEDESPKRSRHYHRLPVPDPDTALVLAAILSSSTFYLFYKWTSNCRDLGYKDWSAFPCDPLPPPLHKELADCGQRLAETLRVTAVRRARVYPSGPVTYEEYYPAQAKEILDEIDRALAPHYGFEDEELEYILNYDLKYRMGRRDTEHDEH